MLSLSLESFLVEPSLAGAFAVRANVCVVDAASFTKVAAYLQPAVNQVRSADGVILNKCDLAAAPAVYQLNRLVAGLNPRAPQCRVAFGQVPEEFLDSLTHQPAGLGPSNRPPLGIAASTVRGSSAVTRARFAQAAASLGDALLRLKGHVLFDDGLRLVEMAGPGEWAEAPPSPSSPNETALTVITWQAPPDAVQKAFDDISS